MTTQGCAECGRTEEGPLARYQRQRSTLVAIAERLTDEAERHVMLMAVDAFRGRYEDTARHEEERVHTRHYCGICYNPIPYGDDVRLRADKQQRRAHKSCEHLYYRNMAETRRKIKAGRLHEPGSCYSKDKCPFFQSIPTMADKVPATWTERI